jgi:hypothetical protein
MSSHRRLGLIGCVLISVLSACATAPTPDAGYLSRYDNLGARGEGMRASVREWADIEALKPVSTVRLEPAVLLPGADPSGVLNPEEQRGLLREIDAQLCFELSESFTIAGPDVLADAKVRSAVTWFLPTGRAASVASAAAAFFIPGPIDIRAPWMLGALGVEAEMTLPDGRQVAAIAWARQANAIGTDAPSLMKAGDALQFAEPFADDAARVMSPVSVPDKGGFEPGRDPCRAYGPRVRAGSFVTKVITNLYIPLSTETPETPSGDADQEP